MIDDKEGPENPRNRALRLIGLDAKRDDAGSHSFGLLMGQYHDYNDMVAFMRRIHETIPPRTRMVSIGKTVEGRDTWGIQASF